MSPRTYCATGADRVAVVLADRLRGELRTAAAADAAEIVRIRIDVSAALRTLSDADQELIRLVHWDGFALTAAAAIVGLNASTARTRYARARARLAGLLGVEDAQPEASGRTESATTSGATASPSST